MLRKIFCTNKDEVSGDNEQIMIYTGHQLLLQYWNLEGNDGLDMLGWVRQGVRTELR
jgi:hypothetical protein